MATEVQSIVRQEMRLLMEAQHQGILAVLEALDERQATQSSRPTSFPQQSKQSASGGHGRAVHPGGQAVVNDIVRGDVTPNSMHKISVIRNYDLHAPHSTTEDPAVRDEELLASAESGIRALQITDLNVDKPMKASDLEQTKHLRPVPSQHDQENARPMQRDVQNEIHSERNISVDTGQENIDKLKENVPPVANLCPFAEGNMKHTEPKKVNKHDKDLDSAFLLDGGFRLLRLQPPDQEAIRLPKIPFHAWQDNAFQQQGFPTQQNMPNMPLLNTRNAFMSSVAGNSYHAHELPERDRPPSAPIQISANGPMPLLTLRQTDYKPHGHTVTDLGAPSLVPPHDILNFEQKKYDTDVPHSDAIQQAEVEPLGKKLLRPDTMEAFAPVDNRDSQKRAQRRSKKNDDRGKQEVHSSKKLVKAGKVAENVTDPLTLTENALDLQSESGRVIHVKSVHDKIDDASSRDVSQDRVDRPITQPEVLKLHSGYALTPGLFDEYLEHQDTLGAARDTTASTQYKAAMAIKTVPTSPKKHVATDTGDSVDQGARVTRDTGTDPVSEAIQNYYRSKTGHTATILPPDVFFALRYEDSEESKLKPSEDDARSQDGRAFLNVVDIAGKVVDDMVAAEGDQGYPKVHSHSPTRHQPVIRTQPETHSLQSSYEDELVVPSQRRTQKPGPDRTTSNLLGQNAEQLVPERDEPGDFSHRLTLRSKSSIRNRLDSMEHQFSAIETMTKNIDDDFKNTNLLIHTIDQIGEAIYPKDRRPEPMEQKPHTIAATLELTGDGEDESRNLDSLLTPRDEEFQTLDHKTEGEELKEKIEELLEDTLSPDISPIRQEQRSSQDPQTLQSTGDSAKMSLEEILGALKHSSPRVHKREKKTEEDTQKLHEWMEKKHAERLRKYKDVLTQRRSAEHHPYQPKEVTQSSPGQTGLLLDTDKQQKLKKERIQESIERRKAIASQLMKDIISDKPSLVQQPPLPEEPSSSSFGKTFSKQRHASPRTGIKGKTVVRRVASPSPVRTHRSELDSWDRMDEANMNSYLEDNMQTYEGYNPDTSRKAYGQATEPGRPAQRGKRPTDSKPETEPEVVVRPYKPRPFTDLVKLQQPESTRRGRPKQRPLTYSERLAQMQRKGPVSGSAKAPPRTYVIPDTSRRQAVTRQGMSPHRKPGKPQTYAEQLQKLQPPKEQYQNRDSSTERMRTVTRTGKSPQRKPGKLLTYAEQLKKLQPSKEQYRQGDMSGASSRVQTGKRQGVTPRRKPGKPMTYAEQLQQLQPPKESYSKDEGFPGPRMYQTRPIHSTISPGRSRPYGDPYATGRSFDESSAASHWSLDDKVRHLLYDDQSSSQMPSANGSHFNFSEISELEVGYSASAYGDEQPYTSMVGVGDIMDAASVSSGSIMSFIDWDQVDQLISDIH